MNKARPIENITGWIQRGIKLNLLYGNQHSMEVVLYLQKLGFKIKKERVMSVMQRMVRKKHKGYKTVQFMRDFVPNPNPNSN